MARTKDDPQTHTPASLESIAGELERMAATLRACAGILTHEPQVSTIQIRYERSLTEGRDKLKTWVADAAVAAENARLLASREPANGRTRKIGHVSDEKSKR